jgi:hypothetical protein
MTSCGEGFRMGRTHRLRRRLILVVAAVVAIALLAVRLGVIGGAGSAHPASGSSEPAAGSSLSGTRGSPSSGAPLATSSPLQTRTPLPTPLATSAQFPPNSATPSMSPGVNEVDTAEGVDGRVPVAVPDRIELYAGAVSVTPGEPITLHVSTPARTYGFAVVRLDATLPGGGQSVARSTGRVGHDYRSRATFDSLTRVARANWPATDTLDTTGWAPGVYVATATDARGGAGQAIFVVRTPVLQADEPAFAFSALTYEAYNLWGGANLYDYAAPRAARVSFERPYALDGGKGYWTRDDDRILAWLQTNNVPLQYTTDYDLSVAPPSVPPGLLIFARHSEYIAAGLYDFVEQHVNVRGDMNLLNFGANSFYWQVRLAPPRTPGAPLDIVCYKSPTADPLAQADSAHATVRWRDAPLGRPEGLVLGAQYAAVLGDGFRRFDYTVNARMPAALLDGTGWGAGTVIHGLLFGEGDVVYPGSGGIAIIDGRAADSKGKPVETSVTIRTSQAGARVFDAGTFGWADGFAPSKIDLGPSSAGFDRFNRNVLAWLGFPTGN